MKECMETDKNVQILLSTYNGVKYLREQLDSFVNLVGFERVKVLIRDDGSTDGTLEILKEYQERYGFEIVTGENIGVNDSMFWLFKHCDLSCDYFALSDQDDVWLSKKLEISINHLNDLNESKPALFSSCSQIVDESLNYLGNSILPKKGISFFNAMVQNVTPGHTQVFNRAMLKELIESDVIDVHVIDWWIYLIATGIGYAYFDNNFTVKHRQHTNNAIGYELNFWKKILARLKRVRDKDGNSIALQLKSFYNCFGQVLDKDKKTEVERFFSCQKSLPSKINYAVTCKVFRQTLLDSIAFRVLYIFGKYNI